MAYGMGKGGGPDNFGSKGMGAGTNRSGRPGGMKSSPGGNPKSAGKSTAGAGADKAKRSSSTMSKARWDNMTDTMKRKEYGTTSYKKYKESSVGKTGRRKGMKAL